MEALGYALQFHGERSRVEKEAASGPNTDLPACVVVL